MGVNQSTSFNDSAYTKIIDMDDGSGYAFQDPTNTPLKHIQAATQPDLDASEFNIILPYKFLRIDKEVGIDVWMLSTSGTVLGIYNKLPN